MSSVAAKAGTQATDSTNPRQRTDITSPCYSSMVVGVLALPTGLNSRWMTNTTLDDRDQGPMAAGPAHVGGAARVRAAHQCRGTDPFLRNADHHPQFAFSQRR